MPYSRNREGVGGHETLRQRAIRILLEKPMTLEAIESILDCGLYVFIYERCGEELNGRNIGEFTGEPFIFWRRPNNYSLAIDLLEQLCWIQLGYNGFTQQELSVCYTEISSAIMKYLTLLCDKTDLTEENLYRLLVAKATVFEEFRDCQLIALRSTHP